MDPSPRIAVIDRREWLLGAIGTAVLLGFLGDAGAQEKPAAWADTLKSIIGDAKPIEGKVQIELPEIAENGNTVPFSVSVDSPMTASDHVRAIHIISTGNPVPQIATFRLTPLAGKAMVTSRMRLAQTQDIIAVAELANKSVVMARKGIKVTIGGCGGG